MGHPAHFTRRSRRSALFALAGATFAMLAASTTVLAQTWPARPVRFIVPAPAGSAPDFLGRVLAPKLNEMWGQPVLVDNIVGASGHIGTDRVAKSPADGYTMLFNTIGPIAININLFDKLPFDPAKDFVPITLIAKVPNILCVNNNLPVKSLTELIAYAKANPGKLRFGSAGSGTTPHLSGELFNVMTGNKLIHVPYKSSAQMVTDTISGQVEVIWHNAPAVIQQVKAGLLRGLAITSDRRHASAPDLPTHPEAGLPGYEVTAWFGLLAPTGTPQAVLAKVQADVVKAINMPDVRERFLTQAAEPVGSTAAEFAAFIRAETEKWAKVIKESGAKVE